MNTNEFAAGAGQAIVVYLSDDAGDEVDAIALYREIADDAATRLARGQRLVSMAAIPLEHANVFLGRESSPDDAKIAVAVVYSRSGAASGS
ncbi:MAG: hypothetical protein ACRDGQ_13025 [Candidatus Limnocylindrales bacterium]